MANTTIRLKKSSVASHLPSSTQLEHGEIAINYADGKIFYKDPANNIQQISGSANTFYTVNANGTLLVATSPTDILTINPGENIAITGDFLTDTLTISANLKTVFDQANAAYNRANSSNDVLYVAAAFDTANAAYNKANAANVLAYNTGIGANGYAASVGVYANNYAGAMANAANAYAASLTPNLAPAFAQANQAYLIANAAFDKANISSSGATINVGATPPVGVDPGALWWDTVSGRMFIYYSDVDSNQWVETSPSGGEIDYAAVYANVASIILPTFNAAYNTANASYDVANASFNTVNTAVQNGSSFITVGDSGILSKNVTTSTATDQILDTFSTSAWRSANYVVTMNAGTDYHTTQVTVIHDGTSAYMTEYGMVYTNGNLGLFNTSIVSGTVRLNVTPTFAATTIRMLRTTNK